MTHWGQFLALEGVENGDELDKVLYDAGQVFYCVYLSVRCFFFIG